MVEVPPGPWWRWSTFSVVALGTLLPPAVAAQASSAGWRALTDGGLLLAGAVLWGPALHNIPGVHRTAPVGVAVYLFVQSIVPTFLAVIYVFGHRPFYSAFAGVHRAFGMSRLVDQQAAGVVAKVGTLPVLWSAAWRALAARSAPTSAATTARPSPGPRSSAIWNGPNERSGPGWRAAGLVRRHGAPAEHLAALDTPRVTGGARGDRAHTATDGRVRRSVRRR